jgi:hypothetical protein
MRAAASRCVCKRMFCRFVVMFVEVLAWFDEEPWDSDDCFAFFFCGPAIVVYVRVEWRKWEDGKVREVYCDI